MLAASVVFVRISRFLAFLSPVQRPQRTAYELLDRLEFPLDFVS